MKKLFVFIMIISFGFSMIKIYAASISGTPPTVTITNIDGVTSPAILDPVNQLLNNNISDAFNTAQAEANAELNKYEDQKDLAKGFANANAYASHAASHQGYQDYSLFALTSGLMLGVQLPSFDPEYYEDIDEKVKEDGDLYAGVGAGLSFVNFGLNAGFLYPGLYLNFKVGHLSIDPIDEMSIKSTMLGLGVNYTWIKSRKVFFGIFKWRGISFGSGFIYNKSEVDVEIELDEERAAFSDINLSSYVPGAPTLSGDVIIDPSFILGLDTTTYTIPFDVTTSVRMLWLLNFNLGAGIDINFGSSDILLEATGDVDADLDENSRIGITTQPGSATIDGSTKDVRPSLARLRLTTGVGINLGPVKIDVPLIWYLNTGVAVGVTAGIIW